ncbi:replication factor C small subunit [Fadolivirus algeromassiliense]|jgi:replication factor C subunit 2/4|uniref:Replication factor C small subunit n=1 Tax=Fadolivirus FV1/VV64 TaxID=3070911 RepID=A0A7D3R0K0_9VIRU|nr:replication factor C small subunit [Fadolivirus algeromassiliense]QKF93741.1 replication factor C small subunit [Fadolivirus FV1/VV64]
MITFTELFGNNGNKKTIDKVNNTKYVIPWVDKYRPTKLSEVVYQDDVIKMLSTVLKTGNMPHMLFYGPPGTGKTSSILAIAAELFGPKKFKERVIELNASDERGINIVRNKLVTLAKTAISDKDPNYLCPPYKLIILDEADAMTNEAQSALRKIMENHSSITRFCFICNYINQIIDPITSRCVKIRFKSINETSMTDKLAAIAKNEKMNIDVDAISEIASISNGDMRKAIMLLQKLNYSNKNIVVNDVYEVANMVPIDKLKNIINVSIANTTNVMNIKNQTFEFISNGYPLNLLLNQLTGLIVNDHNLTDKMKSIICLHIANTEKRLIDGADEYLQLLSIFMCIKTTVLNIDSIYTQKN